MNKWTWMFKRLVTLLTYGMSREEAVRKVAATDPQWSETEVRCAAVAAELHFERQYGG